ncbi:hypothetical protein [Nitrosopumilus sp.]|uniref:hypothetical protein n=1 Tax=Nitrosopumilus sp. TaxID=2024843 RepID=UPI003B5B6662
MSKQVFEIRETSHEQSKIQGHYSIQDLIESNVNVGKYGYKYIKIQNCESKLSEEFIYLGFTKAGNPKFGQIISFDSGIVRVQKRIGKFDGKHLSWMGRLYLKSIEEMRGEYYIQ